MILIEIQNFLFGIIYNILGLTHIKNIFFNVTNLKKWSSVLIKNIFLIFVFRKYTLHLINLIEFTMLYYGLLFIFYCFYIPLFCYCYIITIDTISFITKPQNYENKMNFYDKIYIGFFSAIIYLIPLVINQIPYINILLIPIIISIINSFYYFYIDQIRKSTEINELFLIFEKNIYFFLGYGLSESLLYYYLNWEVFHIINIFLLPINIYNISKTKLEKNIKSNEKYISLLFILPILFTNIIIDSIIYLTSVIYNDTSIIEGK